MTPARRASQITLATPWDEPWQTKDLFIPLVGVEGYPMFRCFCSARNPLKPVIYMLFVCGSSGGEPERRQNARGRPKGGRDCVSLARKLAGE